MTTEESRLPSPLAARIHQLWDDLADRYRSDGALPYLLGELAALVEAQNAWWMGAVRVGRDCATDPLDGWRPRAIRYLHESAADRAFYKTAGRLLSTGSVDESVAANMRGAGTFRVNWLPEMVSPDWYASPFHDVAYAARGISDAVFVGCPVTCDAEALLGFHRIGREGSRFSVLDRAVLAYALRSLRWLQRQLLLDHGLLVARQPLTSTELIVLKHLLTGMAEQKIAETVGLARATTHNHITKIYRKFGVSRRAGLMALWLGRSTSSSIQSV